MKFEIRRASAWKVTGENPQPCPEAVFDTKTNEWTVEFDSLDDLVAFTEREGWIVIGCVISDKPGIWIYDDYME